MSILRHRTTANERKTMEQQQHKTAINSFGEFESWQEMVTTDYTKIQKRKDIETLVAEYLKKKEVTKCAADWDGEPDFVWNGSK